MTGGGSDVVFEIQADRVLCDGQEVTDLGAGPWRTRLREAGIESLAFEAGMDAPGFEQRFHEMARQLGLYDTAPVKFEDIELEIVAHGAEEAPPVVPGAPATVEEAVPGAPAITVEEPVVPDAVPSPGTAPDADEAHAAQQTAQVSVVPQETGAGGQDLDEVAELVRWIHGEIAKTGRLPSAETRRVVESLPGIETTGELSVASPCLLVPADGYTTSHCLSVALMATALAAHLEYDGDELGLVTEAALLHDIGKVRLPLGDVAPDGLTAEQRSVMERHPAEGARVLLAGPAEHTLSAVVAYEHHMAWQGETGYPPRHYPRNAHRFSRLVQICDAYDVLRSTRPFRPALSHDSALEYMRLQASSAFDPDLVTAFADLCGARALPRICDPAAGERKLSTVELSRMPDGVFDADTETPPIRL